MPRAPLLVGAVAAGDWGVRPNNSSLFPPLAAVVVVALIGEPLAKLSTLVGARFTSSGSPLAAVVVVALVGEPLAFRCVCIVTQ